MSLPKPSDEVLEAADHGKIRELTDRAYELWAKRARSGIPREQWDALWKEALAAADGHEELLEGVWRFRPSGV